MESLLYAEINLFCILILLSILCKLISGTDMQNNQRLFIRVLVSNVILFVIDMSWIFINGQGWAVSTTINYMINALYFIQSGLAGYYWFLYSESMQKSKLVNTKKKKLICGIPLLFLAIMTVISYMTGWIFYISEDNMYHRGNLYFIQIIIAYGYILFTASKAMCLSFKKRNYIDRKNFFMISSFVILPMSFGVLQTMFVGMPLLCIGVTLSLLAIYIDFQEQQISIDPLTQMNNRNQLMKFLNNRMMHGNEEKMLYLLIMDVDAFKKINDRYGHVEGDLALISVATALKKVVANQNYFISRYGGDEFILVCEVESKTEIEVLCGMIHNTLEMLNHDTNTKYSLSLSIGYAKYTENIHSVQEFISRADAMLYQQKRSRSKVVVVTE